MKKTTQNIPDEEIEKKYHQRDQRKKIRMKGAPEGEDAHLRLRAHLYTYSLN